MLRNGISNIQGYAKNPYPNYMGKPKPKKQKAAPAPAAPASAPAAGPTVSWDGPGLPWDSIAQGQVDQAGTDYTYATSDITGQENAAGLDFGINFDRGADGRLTNFRIDSNVDVTNPYSRAALLKRSYLQNRAGNTNSMAARGQMHSSAYKRAQTNTAFG